MKKISLVFLAMAVFLWAGPAMATPVVDGVFNTAEWAEHYTNDDGVEGRGYVGPGYGGQAYDVEYTGLYFDSDTVYFGLQTGFDLENGTPSYRPGDFALDINNDGYFDYAIDYSISSSDVDYTLYLVEGWNHTAIPAWQNNFFEVHFGTAIYSWTQNNAFSSGEFGNIDGGTSYVLEGSFDINLLAGLGREITLQWTMECGNDVGITDPTTAAPVPEPATMLLFGTGLLGMAVIGRKREKTVK